MSETIIEGGNMDIFDCTPRKIKCVANYPTGIYSVHREELEIGKIYTMKNIEVDRWCTAVFLEEFPDTSDYAFNSVYFDEVEETPKRILDLIPDGKENAISRKMLVQKAVHYGLVSKKVKDKDREVRLMIQKERETTPILTKPEGGYYVPTPEETTELAEYIYQERGRALAILSTVRRADTIFEDLMHKRISEVRR